MTVNLAWHDRRCVYLVADSAITTADRPPRTVSAFGETTAERRDGKFVQEGALKIEALAERAAAVFNGDLTQARGFLAEVRSVMAKGASASAAVNEIATERPVVEGADFEVLIGSYEDSSGSELLHYRSHGKQLLPVPPLTGDIGDEERVLLRASGELPDQIGSQLLTTIARLHRWQTEDALKLVAAVGALQSCCIYQALLQQGAGGTCFGLMVDSAGLRAMEDTCWCLFSDIEAPRRRDDDPVAAILPLGQTPTRIVTMMRDGVPLVVSDDDKVTFFATIDVDQQGALLSSINDQLNQNAFPFWVLLHTVNMNVLILDRRSPAGVHVVTPANGDVLFSDQIIDALRWKPPSPWVGRNLIWNSGLPRLDFRMKPNLRILVTDVRPNGLVLAASGESAAGSGWTDPACSKSLATACKAGLDSALVAAGRSATDLRNSLTIVRGDGEATFWADFEYELYAEGAVPVVLDPPTRPVAMIKRLKLVGVPSFPPSGIVCTLAYGERRAIRINFKTESRDELEEHLAELFMRMIGHAEV